MRTLPVEIDPDCTGPRGAAEVKQSGPLPMDGDRTDAELLEDIRNGKTALYGVLYQRHLAAAYNLARQLRSSQADWDELVSTAFVKVLDVVLGGRTNLTSAFRAYLLTTMRHHAYDNTRRGRRFEFVEDVTMASGVRPESVSTPFIDTVVADCDKSLAAQAFKTLPERWQKVLMYTEIEGMSPAEVAPRLGLTPNGVSALAYRAREGLKQAYLQVHLSANVATRCQDTTGRLGAAVRGGLSPRDTDTVATHLDDCDDCRGRSSYLRELNSQLR